MADEKNMKKWREFERTLAEVRRGFSGMPPEELQALVDEACAHVRGELWLEKVSSE